jgi:DedD protein
MGRRDYKNARRPQQEGQAAQPRKGGGLGTGLFVGVLLGMAIAGGMYWYLVGQRGDMKPIESAPEIVAPKDSPASGPVTPVLEKPPGKPPETTPAKEAASAPEDKPAAAPKPDAEPRREAGAKESARKPEKPAPAAARASEPRKAAKQDYSFYDILPGKTAPKPAQPVKAKEQYWLQVAALKAEADAERLKARLALLGLPVSVQKVTSGELTLHRVRVGPYASEDAGLNALDTLSTNDFEPRWVKDPVTP